MSSAINIARLLASDASFQDVAARGFFLKRKVLVLLFGNKGLGDEKKIS